MAMTNYRDISTSPTETGAGFQFEFFCELTGETWRSPFKPYRKGQLSGLVARATGFLYQLHDAGRVIGYAADAGARKAKAAALADAMEIAVHKFHQCESCNKWVCLAAWDADSGRCNTCARKGGNRNAGSYGGNAYREQQHDEPEAASAGPACPNCQTASQGGRFCHECGYDMASVFKSCPGCGTTLPRQARFCTDCGHGF